MQTVESDERYHATSFGLRKIAPRGCVAAKRHVQAFLRETLENLGFITRDWHDARETLLDFCPDVVLVGVSTGGADAVLALQDLAAEQFTGRVLLFGDGETEELHALETLGRASGLNMLPSLPTPLTDASLRTRLAGLIPVSAPPSPVVDLAEALHSRWLELWYQPKVDIRSFTFCGAEALIRMRHPYWGVVEPSQFIPDSSDPAMTRLSRFVISNAMQAWEYFVGQYGHVDLAINIPLKLLAASDIADELVSRLPRDDRFEGLLVEVNASEFLQDPHCMKAVANRLRLHKIGISVDDVGSEWPALLEYAELPFVEIKVDRSLVAGCAIDRDKRSACGRITKFADAVGARTVAEGVEDRADFMTAVELQFDVVQGYFFGKAMDARRFAKQALHKPVTMPGSR